MPTIVIASSKGGSGKSTTAALLASTIAEHGASGVVRLASPANHGSLLEMTMSQNPYRGFCFAPEVIQHAVWLYHCLESIRICGVFHAAAA